MTEINRLSDLKKLAESIRAERRKSRKIRLVVHMGTCCIAAGSSEVLDAMRYELHTLKLEQKMDVVPGGCTGLCYAEPTVAVCYPDGKVEYYGNLDPQQGRMIVNRCLTQSPVIGLNQIVPGWELTERRGVKS